MRSDRERVWLSGRMVVLSAAGIAGLVIWTLLENPGTVQEGPGRWIIAAVVVLAVAAAVVGQLFERQRLSDAKRLEDKLDAAIRHSDEVVKNARRLSQSSGADGRTKS